MLDARRFLAHFAAQALRGEVNQVAHLQSIQLLRQPKMRHTLAGCLASAPRSEVRRRASLFKRWHHRLSRG